jgi:hypothetical protein
MSNVEDGTAVFTFELRWASGNLIKRFQNVPDLQVERFTQDMDEGLIEDLPKARTTCSGEWLEHYELVYNDQVLQCGQWFSDYAIPPNAIIIVVLEITTGNSQ